MSQIRDLREGSSNPNRSYNGLCGAMFEKEYIWFIPNDDNRLGDGLDLRIDFCRQRNLPLKLRGEMGYCSFLEVLIALSRRLAWNAGGTAPNWAWHLVRNLQLDIMYDPIGPKKARRIDEILDMCIWRTYAEDGSGGFFPLAWPERDQTKLEVWYQMHAYIDEIPET